MAKVPLIAAHRAGNSYKAIDNAIRLGADIIELDVRMTNDGFLVVSHSPKIDIDGEVLYIGEAKLNYLNRRISKSRGSPIIQLRDILYYVKERNIKLLIDIKNGPQIFYPNIHINVAQTVSECHMDDNAKIISFDQNCIYELKHNYRFPIKMGVLIDELGDMQKLIDRIGIDFFETKNVYLTSEVVAEAHNFGVEIISWSTDDPKEIKRLIALSIDIITTESPQSVQEILSNMGELQMRDLKLR
jgi:glycerophosphoryl diester phosphodiesterase